MLTLNHPLLFINALLIAGCAQAPFKVGTDHPANPDATAAPLLAQSTTLVIAEGPGPTASEGQANHDAVSSAQTGAHQHATQAPTATKVMYMCPMHPDVTSNDPDAKCPKCGMKINKPVHGATTTQPGQTGEKHPQHEGH